MTALPLVWIVSVLTTIAAYTLARNTRTPFQARQFLCIFLLTLAVIGLLIGIRLSSEIRWAAIVQPFIAVIAAPSAYLGFYALANDTNTNWNNILLRNLLLVGIAQIGILTPIAVSADVFVLAINVIYLIKIAGLSRFTDDEFSSIPHHNIRIVRSAIYATMTLIGMMVAIDGLIVAVSIFAREPFLMELLTGVSGIFSAFVFVVALVGGPMILRSPQDQSDKVQIPTDRDLEVMQALEILMNEKHLFKDNNLTLARVAKRLSMPVRDVSTATNRITGENFSRYMNAHRIRHAQRALHETDLPVTEIMFDAGFISKSSFNTEFRRLTGQTPSQFRATKAAR